MVERIELWTLDGVVRTCRFKGSTLTEISPPINLCFDGHRQDFRKDKAPKRKVTRYVTPLVLKW